MPDSTRTSTAARRSVDALLRGSGARSVILRIHAPAIPGANSEQLGLAVPQFQDVELAPVIFRNTAARTASNKPAGRDLLVSATAVQALTGLESFASATELFASAYCILIDETPLTIVSAHELEAGGAVCGYHLELRENNTPTT